MAGGNSSREILERLSEIDPYDFEQFVADLWERQGYETEVLARSNDLGVDVIATQEGEMGLTVAIQAKRYALDNKIHRDELQRYTGLDREIDRIDSVAIVTTSGFSDGAWRLAQEQNIRTFSGEDLTNLVEKYKAQDLVDRYTGTRGTVSKEPESGEAHTIGDLADRASGKDDRSFMEAVSESVVPAIVIGSLIWFGAIYAVMELSGFVSEIGFWTIFLMHFILPGLVFKDSLKLHRVNANSRPNRITWPLITFFFGGIASSVYLFLRGVNL